MRGLRFGAAIWLVCFVYASLTMGAAAETPPDKPAEALYLQLGRVGLDPTRVYRVRDASLDRPAVHITLEDGTIGFTQDVMGRITGAFFEGDGEILLTPPNSVERRSISLFTGMAILEEHFVTAYFRFNDDAANELGPDLRAADNQREFVNRWETTAENLASGDATRLLMSFSRMLPETGNKTSAGRAEAAQPGNGADRYLHARLQGTKLGVFDVYFDSSAAEQVQAGQAKTAEARFLLRRVDIVFGNPAKGDADKRRRKAGTSRGKRVGEPGGSSPVHDQDGGASSKTNSCAGANAV